MSVGTSAATLPPPGTAAFFSEEEARLDTSRRRIYLMVLPIGAIAALWPWVYDLTRPGGDPYHRLALLPLAMLLAVVAALLWRKALPLRFVELTGYAGVTLFLLARVGYDFLGSGLPVVREGSAEFYSWIPVVYLLSFLLYDANGGLIRASLLYLAILGIGGYSSFLSWVSGQGIAELGATVQFYTSHVVLIALLYVLVFLKDAYQRARVLAEAMAQLAQRDFQLGIPNRRQLYTSLEQETARAGRYGQPLSLLLFDVDHFKAVNDTYGHDVGDYVLEAAARAVQRQLRAADEFGRWGGDEFLVLAPGADLDQAQHLAERLQQTIAAMPLEQVGTVTASFGVAAYQAEDTPVLLVKRADQALYRAKASGRNRVEVAE